VFLIVRNRAVQSSQPTRPESEYRALLERKADVWSNSVFSAQAPDGGIKMSLSSAEQTTQVWQTAQCLAGVLSMPKSFDGQVPKIKSAFRYIEGLHRTTPAEGWNLYGNSNKFTITEIASWVTLASIKSLDSKTRVWDNAEKEEVLKQISRNLEEITRRQETAGGWRPIQDENPEFSRTYPTVMALWSLIEARKSPSASGRVGNKYDENIRKGINWLLRGYKEGQGWVPNPNRAGQKDRFDGLTAQTLFVLSRAEALDTFAYIKSDQTYRSARQGFIKNRQFVDWSIEGNNSHMPDADLRFLSTEFLAEGSTFLWFPWTLAELSQLSVDQGLTQGEREAAAQLRLDIFNANADKLENYVESANLMYVLGENLLCVAAYLDAGPAKT
jgi:hypothetical protein